MQEGVERGSGGSSGLLDSLSPAFTPTANSNNSSGRQWSDFSDGQGQVVSEGMGMNMSGMSRQRDERESGENYFRSVVQTDSEGQEKNDEDIREDFSRRPSSALSDPTADYMQDDFTLLTSDTHSYVPLEKWMIKAWLPIVFSGFDSDIIEGFILKLRDDGGFVTVQVQSVCVCLNSSHFKSFLFYFISSHHPLS